MITNWHSLTRSHTRTIRIEHATHAMNLWSNFAFNSSPIPEWTKSTRSCRGSVTTKWATSQWLKLPSISWTVPQSWSGMSFRMMRRLVKLTGMWNLLKFLWSNISRMTKVTWKRVIIIRSSISTWSNQPPPTHSLNSTLLYSCRIILQSLSLGKSFWLKIIH